MNRAVIPLLLMALSGCRAVGPDYARPQSALPESWGEQAGGGALPVAWWSIFNDAPLSQLVQRVAAGNLDLQLATARMQQSRALLGVTEAALMPDLSLDGAYQRQRATSVGSMDPSGNGGEADYNLWRGGFSATWELDMWGKLRRASESARAGFAASQENRRALLTSVTAEVASDYLRLRATQQQLAVAQENRATALRTLQLTQSRYQSGAGNELDIDQAQVQLAQVDALLPTLFDRQERLINAISLLLGERPGALKAMLSPTGPLPTLARAVPMGVPSDLALRRPDIREAAARLHQATAEIGVATADYYPRITLTGNAGYQALALADMGSWSTHTFAIGPALYLPLFDGENHPAGAPERIPAAGNGHRLPANGAARLARDRRRAFRLSRPAAPPDAPGRGAGRQPARVCAGARQLSERRQRFYPRSEHAACAAGSAVRANCFRGGDGDRRGEYLSSAGRRLGTHLPVCGATGEG